MECVIFWDLRGINLDDTCVCCEQWCEKYKQGTDSEGDGDQWIDHFKQGSDFVWLFIGVVLEMGFLFPSEVMEYLG